MSGGSGTAFSTYIRTAPGGWGVRSLWHVLYDSREDRRLSPACFIRCRGGDSLQHLLFGSGRIKDNFQHVRCDTGSPGEPGPGIVSSNTMDTGYRGSHRPPFVSALGPGNYLWFSTYLSSTMSSVGQTLMYVRVGIPVPTYTENTVLQFRIHSIFAECEGAR